MFDFTPTIALSACHARLYLIARILLYSLFILLSFIVLYKVLFPSAYFSFDFTKPNALANTIAQPYERSNALLFDTAVAGSFDRAHVTLKIAPDHTLSADTVTLRRGYAAQFYPFIDRHETNRKDPVYTILPGTLVGRSGGVWIVTDRTHIAAIADAQTLIAKGWSFDDVITAGSDDVALYKKRKLFTMKDVHPDGTILYTTDTDRYELIYNKERFPISANDIRLHYKEHSIVAVTDASQTTVSTCTLAPHRLPWRSGTYTCTIPMKDLHSLTGTDYQFRLSGTNLTTFRDINITLHRGPTTDNARASLALIKQRFLNKYTKE